LPKFYNFRQVRITQKLNKHLQTKLIAFLLLPLFLYMTAGFHVFFAVQLNCLNNKALNDIKTQNLSKTQILFFSQEQFDALKFVKPHEFIFENNMYDIVKIEHISNKIKVFCKLDKKETLLFKFYSKTEPNANEKNGKTTNFQQIKINLFFVETYKFSVFNNLMLFCFPHKLFRLIKRFSEIYCPPS